MYSFYDFLSGQINSETPFIFYGDKKITYSEFTARVDETAGFLSAKGITARDNVGIISDNCPEFIEIVFALWKLNAVPVSLNIKLQPDEIKELMSFTDCKRILINKNFPEEIDTENILPFPFNNLTEKSEVTESPFNKDNTALIMFTSGSSGKSKGVMLSFDNLIQSAEIGNQVLNHSPNDRWLASLPFYHIGGFSIIIRTFIFSCSVVIPDSLKSEDIIISMYKYNPTHISFVSTQLKRILDKNVKPNALKRVLLGGGFTDTKLVDEAINSGWPVIKVYGSTETSSFISAVNVSEISDKAASSGKALQPNRVFIVDDKKEKIPENKSGEIVVESPALMKGYYKNPNDTTKKIRNSFYYTGDIGYLDKDGYLFVEARRSDLIISGGENIIPAEVEKAIFKFPHVKDVFVFGIDDVEWGQIVSAAIVFEKNKRISEDDLVQFLKKNLSGFKVPKKVFFIEGISRTSLGKVQKEKLLIELGLKKLSVS